MEGIRQYVLSVICAAILCAVIVRLAGKQGAVGGIIKMISAVFISISILSPFLKLQVKDLTDSLAKIELDAEDIISEAEQQVKEETTAIITDRVQSYIKDKAASYGAQITATVSFTDITANTPDTVTIEGDVSPYVKKVLKDLIVSDLGIPEEKQIWK